MSRFMSTARFASLVAVAIVLFTSGLVAGAVGDPLVLGSLTNSSGSAGTKVSSSVNGNAFAVAQSGVGASANGIRGDANTGTGGVFTSTSNNALFATAASGNRFAMVATSNGGAGTGGGLLAIGNANPGVTIDVDSNSIPPLEVNSTAAVANLNSDLVDGWHANSLNRVAYANDNVVVDGDVASTGRLTTTITAPARGWLIINGSAYIFNESTSGSDDARCAIEVNDVEQTGSRRWVDTDFTGAAGGLTDETVCVSTVGYTVCSSTTYTIDMEFSSIGVDLNVYDGALVAQFVPFDGSGSQPSFLSCPIIILGDSAAADADRKDAE